jgi:hypothetical protein
VKYTKDLTILDRLKPLELNSAEHQQDVVDVGSMLDDNGKSYGFGVLVVANVIRIGCTQRGHAMSGVTKYQYVVELLRLT